MKIMMNAPAANVAKYLGVLEKAPILVKSITSGVVYLFGDLCSQLISGKKVGQLSRMRMVASGLSGLLFHGILSHTWYGWLDHTIEHTLGMTAWWNIFPMIVLDSLILCPTWNAIYIGTMALFLGRSVSKAWNDVKKTAFPLFKSGLKLWVPANAITYGLVPLQLRVLWCDFIEFIWCIIMSKSGGHAH